MASSGESPSNCFDTSSTSDPSKAVNGYSSDYYAPTQNSVGQVTEVTFPNPEFGGHDAETVGHDRPKYLAWASTCGSGWEGSDSRERSG